MIIDHLQNDGMILHILKMHTSVFKMNPGFDSLPNGVPFTTFYQPECPVTSTGSKGRRL